MNDTKAIESNRRWILGCSWLGVVVLPLLLLLLWLYLAPGDTTALLILMLTGGGLIAGLTAAVTGSMLPPGKKMD